MVGLLGQTGSVLDAALVVEAREVGVHVTSQVDLDVIGVHVELVGAEVAVSVHGQLGESVKSNESICSIGATQERQ